jgi:hypothetical protein
MTNRKRAYVAVKVDGVVSIHAPDVTGNYATLCGIDGDDPGCGQFPAKVPKWAKIDCKTCQMIIRLARTYTEKDFYAPNHKSETPAE